MPNNTTFEIPKDGYLAFDALTLKQFIKDRLNETGVFTDQNYEGSYISTVNEIIAYTFNALLFYLNKTSTESMFSESMIYENMNRVVKLLDYKPIGAQTATLSFDLTAGQLLPAGVHVVPRYAYFANGDKSYSFTKDIVFTKTVPQGQSQSLDAISNENLLFQGRYREYPVYTAVGNENEVVFLAVGDNVIVDHFSIDVYVKRGGVWREWREVTSLYMENAFSEAYELRLNESRKYEIRFGNNINGAGLQQGDKVAIYYIQSSGSAGELSVNGINNKPLNLFSSQTYREIFSDAIATNVRGAAFIDTSTASQMRATNDNTSTYFQAIETVESMRESAPAIFRSQYRLVTTGDYESYLRTNFANLLHDVSVINNDAYLSSYVKYFYDIGINDPSNVSNISYNQLLFADACNFNNVYVTAVPKTVNGSSVVRSLLTPSQKELLITSIREVKPLTAETVILDPVYIAADFALSVDGKAQASIKDVEQTELLVQRSPGTRRDTASIQQEVMQMIRAEFTGESRKLGQSLDVADLTNRLLNISGVHSIFTRRRDNHRVSVNGLAMILWNPVYTTDITTATANTSVESFKFLYMNSPDALLNKITVSAFTNIIESVEY